MYQYKNMITKEILQEDELEDKIFDRLGITIEAKGNDGTLTLEQEEFKTTFIEWYLSDNWIKEKIEEE